MIFGLNKIEYNTICATLSVHAVCDILCNRVAEVLRT